MQVLSPNDVKIYDLSAGRSLPDWVTDEKKRKLRKKEDTDRRIELIQDFAMPGVSSCVTVTADQKHILATGAYKPRLRCYDTANLCLKFERCLDQEVIKLVSLSEDYSKFVMLQSDRHVEFHAQPGRYYRTRIPTEGRDLAYDWASCQLAFASSSPDIYRLDLETGVHMKPLSTSGPTSALRFNSQHRLLVTAGASLECWDPRAAARVSALPLDSPATTLEWRSNLQLGVGSSNGVISIFDIRSRTPLVIKDHNNELPIRSIVFSGDITLSLDSRAIKLWRTETGAVITAVEPGVKLNQLTVFPDSGLLFVANEAPKILTYYIPAVGKAPRWCSFLDSMAEELEETAAPSVYDDYRFLSLEQLKLMGLEHLVGTSLLRAYMHGYFMDARLYAKIAALAPAAAYDTYKKEAISAALKAERRVAAPPPKVNSSLAARLGPGDKLTKDDRFGALFTDTKFAIDSAADEFKLVNPLMSRLDRKEKRREFEERETRRAALEAVESEEDEDLSESEEELSEEEIVAPLKQPSLASRLKTEGSIRTAGAGNLTVEMRLGDGGRKKKMKEQRKERSAVRRSAADIERKFMNKIK